MKNTDYLLLPLFFLIMSCSGGNILDKQITQLIKNKDFDQVSTVKNKLLNWEGSAVELGEKSREVADFLRKNERVGEAMTIVTNCLDKHFEEAGSAENAELLAKIYDENMKKPQQAALIRQYTAEHPKETVVPASEQIREIGRAIFADESKGFNRQIAREFITASENYALLNPGDSLAPVFLIDAATIARNLGSPEKTLKLFHRVYTKFPNHPKAPESMFYEAFTYDADMKNYEKAGVAYRSFIEKHPEHSFTEQAKIMLENLGKTDEELLEALSKKE